MYGCSLRVKYPLNLCFTSPTQNSPLWLEKVHPRSQFFFSPIGIQKRGKIGGGYEAGSVSCAFLRRRQMSAVPFSHFSVFLLSSSWPSRKCLWKGSQPEGILPYMVIKVKAHELKAQMREFGHLYQDVLNGKHGFCLIMICKQDTTI